MTAFVLVQSAIVAALQAALPSVDVWTNRVRPLGREVDAAVMVRLSRSVEVPGNLGAQDWATTFDVECIARTSSGSDPAAACDALFQAAWVAVRSVRDTTPDVIDLDAEPQIEWLIEAAETPMVSVTFRLLAVHRTKAADLTPWSS